MSKEKTTKPNAATAKGGKAEKPSKRTPAAAKPVKKAASLAPDKLVLLVTVVNRSKSEYYQDLIQSFNSNFQLSSFATGTARRALGLLTPDAEKDVIFSVLTRENAKLALGALEQKFDTIRGGKGVSFTIPMTSTIGVLIYRFLCNKQ